MENAGKPWIHFVAAVLDFLRLLSVRNQEFVPEVKINWFRGESQRFVFVQLFVRIVLLQQVL